MNDRTIALIVFIFIGFMNCIMQILTPKVSKKELYFGVRIPLEYINDSRLKKLYSKYVIDNIKLFCIFVVACILIPFNSEKIFVFFQAGNILIYILLCFLVYYKINIKVKSLKEENKWINTKKAITYIDTNFAKDKKGKMLVSPLWFLIPVIIIIVNIFINYNFYDKLPEMLPTHWDFSGRVNGWMKKSSAVKQMPAVQCFLTVIMFFVYKTIGWSKQQLSSSNPETSKQQNLRFRYIWSAYIVAMTVVMNLLFTFANLTIIQLVVMKGKSMLIITFSIVLAIIISTIVISLKVGQSGSKLNSLVKETNEGSAEREDDKYWRLGGTIYFNKEDPSIFIEKRFGVGWTMNFGRVQSIVILVVFLLIIIFLPIMLSI